MAAVARATLTAGGVHLGFIVTKRKAAVLAADRGTAVVAMRRLSAMAKPLQRSASPQPQQEAARERRQLYRKLSLLHRDPAASVAATLDSWVAEKQALSEAELLRCARDLRRYGRHGRALEVMDWMEARGMNMSSGTHAMRIDLIVNVKGISAAETYFSCLPGGCKDAKTYSALFNCYVKLGMEEEANELYTKMKELKLEFSSALVQNSLMTLNIKSGHPEKVPAIFEEMKASHVRPDDYTYAMMVQSYASLNDLESAEKLVEDLERCGTRLDWNVYTTLASQYISAGQFKKAEGALKKAESVMGKNYVMSFNYLISLYAGAGNLSEVKRVWKLLKSFFPKPINRCYLDMLRALSKLDDIKSLKQCYEEWESHRTYYDIRLTNVLISNYLKKDMIDDAIGTWRRAMEGDCSNCATFHLFTEYYLKKGQVNLASECLQAEIIWAKEHNWSNDQMPPQKFVDKLAMCVEDLNDGEGSKAIYRLLRKLTSLSASEA